MTLEGIDNVDDFVDQLERIEPPGQLISYLTDPLLQKFVELKPSPIMLRRIELWLSTCLEEQYNALKEGSIDHQYLSEILDGLVKHAQYTKVYRAFYRQCVLCEHCLPCLDFTANRTDISERVFTPLGWSAGYRTGAGSSLLHPYPAI